MKALVVGELDGGFEHEDVDIALRDVNEGYAALKDGSLNRVVVTSF